MSEDSTSPDISNFTSRPRTGVTSLPEIGTKRNNMRNLDEISGRARTSSDTPSDDHIGGRPDTGGVRSKKNSPGSGTKKRSASLGIPGVMSDGSDDGFN